MDETQLEDFIIIGRALVLLVAIALIIPAGSTRGGNRCARRGSSSEPYSLRMRLKARPISLRRGERFLARLT